MWDFAPRSPRSMRLASSTSCAAVKQSVPAGFPEEELQRVGRRFSRALSLRPSSPPSFSGSSVVSVISIPRRSSRVQIASVSAHRADVPRRGCSVRSASARPQRSPAVLGRPHAGGSTRFRPSSPRGLMPLRPQCQTRTLSVEAVRVPPPRSMENGGSSSPRAARPRSFSSGQGPRRQFRRLPRGCRTRGCRSRRRPPWSRRTGRR